MPICDAQQIVSVTPRIVPRALVVDFKGPSCPALTSGSVEKHKLDFGHVRLITHSAAHSHTQQHSKAWKQVNLVVGAQAKEPN